MARSSLITRDQRQAADTIRRLARAWFVFSAA